MSTQEMLARLSEAFRAGIAASHLRLSEGDVKISAKSSPDGKDHTRPYPKVEALTAEGMALICGGKFEPATAKPEDGTKDERTEAEKAAGACDYFNYGYDLSIRATERSKLESELEGPEKAIAKAVKGLVENAGFDEEGARAVVIAQRTKQGLPV